MPETYGDYIAVLTAGLRKESDTEPPTAPATPTITAVNDETGTSATITVDGDAGVTNRLRYRRLGTGAWTVGLTRTGDGTIQQTGLTTGTYQFLVVSDNGGVYSLPSNEVTVRVEDPDAAVAATGSLSLPLYYLRRTVAASATFQAWVGAPSADAALPFVQVLEAVPALARATITAGAVSAITVDQGGGGYYAAPAVTITGDGAGAVAAAAVTDGAVTSVMPSAGGTGYTHAAVEIALPARIAVADLSPQWARRVAAMGSRNFFRQTGDLLLILQEDVNPALDPDEVATDFTNTVGAIIAEIEELSGTAGYLDWRSLSYAQRPARQKIEEAGEHDFCRTVIRFGFEGL